MPTKPQPATLMTPIVRLSGIFPTFTTGATGCAEFNHHLKITPDSPDVAYEGTACRGYQTDNGRKQAEKRAATGGRKIKSGYTTICSMENLLPVGGLCGFVYLCSRNYRFSPEEVAELAEVLQLPEYIRNVNRLKEPRREALCMLLARFTDPKRYVDLHLEFGWTINVYRTFAKQLWIVLIGVGLTSWCWMQKD
ncbi:hypothetical protein EDC01DRAFT_635797 [Geopyxis carbonaria]|nr:hypothetical protein EDC01DRAFT_635797 [Geopyxis carbonaria]